MWWFKKKEEGKPLEKKSVASNILTITMKDGSSVISSTDTWDTSLSKVSHWKKFYTWYFGRESEDWMLIAKNMDILIKRSDIKTFSVKVKEKV